MLRYCLLILLLLSINLYSETKVKFRGYVESSGLCEVSNDDEVYQGYTILSNQYAKIIPEKGMNIIASVNQTFLSGLASDEYSAIYGVKDSYILGFDIERLFFSYRVNRFKTSFGVQRLSRGFNFAFTPFDFINKNSVTTSNSPQGKLSLVSEIETTDFSNISFYYIPPEDPMEKEITSTIAGVLFKQYGGIVDFQAQYNYIEDEHLVGLAFKGDLVVGYASEIVYTLDNESFDISMGLDYTFDFEKELAVRFEYYLNSSGLESDDNWNVYTTEQYPFKHNLYGSLNQTITDDLNIEVSAIVSPITESGIAMMDIDYRVSDSSSLKLKANLPVDNSSDIGEYAPERLGHEMSIGVSYKIKF